MERCSLPSDIVTDFTLTARRETSKPKHTSVTHSRTHARTHASFCTPKPPFTTQKKQPPTAPCGGRVDGWMTMDARMRSARRRRDLHRRVPRRGRTPSTDHSRESASRSSPPRARRRGDRRMTIAPPRADLDSIAIGARSTRVVCTASSARVVETRVSARARKNKTKYPARVDVRLETDVASREARRVVVVPCAEECRRAAIRAGRRGRPWACVYPVVWFES